MARSKGFWDGEAADTVKKLLLIHSEISEAAEEVRAGNPLSYTDVPAGPYLVGELKPEGLAPELADVLIRTLDLMHGLGIDVEATVTEKMTYNACRGPMHGKQF